MDFKINSVNSVGFNRYSNVQKKQSVSGAAPQAAADNLDISAASRSFASALQAANQSPDVRQDKVDAIRQSVNNGSYATDSRKIAEMMIAYVR